MDKFKKIVIIALPLFLLLFGFAWAGELTDEELTTFVAEEPAVAAEVNANFDAVQADVNDNNSRITTNATGVSANTGAIAANVADVSTNASNITINTAKITRRDGVQQLSWSGIAIDSTSFVEINSITTDDTGTFDVSLTAHCVIEISGGDSGRYQFAIRKDDISGNIVGVGWWRPGSASGNQAVTISFTGFDTSVTGPLTYVFCARKYDSSAPDASIGYYGLNMEWSRQ